jgi:hypothetical protein
MGLLYTYAMKGVSFDEPEWENNVEVRDGIQLCTRV